MNIESSTIIPSSDSFQFYIPLTSTPKRSSKCSTRQPLCSTLAISMECTQQFDLSISAITSIKHSPMRSHLRRTSTIIKRIELKYLLYSTRAMKTTKQRQYMTNDRKIYVVWNVLFKIVDLAKKITDILLKQKFFFFYSNFLFTNIN